MITADVVTKLAPTVSRFGHDWPEIARKIQDGHMMLWQAEDLCVSTEVHEDNVCEIRLGGGKLTKSAVKSLETAILLDKAHSDVSVFRIWGRKGWLRVFPHWRYCGMEDGLVILERGHG